MTTTIPPLDPDAAAVAQQFGAMLPNGLSGLGVDGVREFGRLVDSQVPTGPEVSSVTSAEVAGPHGVIPVRIYRPDSDVPTGALIYIHGGGWTFGSVDGGEDHLCRRVCAVSGIAVVSVDYRMAPEHKFPVPVDEAAAVLAWVRDQATNLGIDPARIAIGGDSAGGNISAAITHLDRGHEKPLAAQVLLYPATEYAVERPSWVDNADAPVLTVRDTLWFWDQYLRTAADQLDPRATPANADSFAGLPRAIVLAAGHDPLRDDGLNYAKLLQDAGTATRVLLVEGAFHGFMTMPGLASFELGTTAVCDFLAEVLSA